MSRGKHVAPRPNGRKTRTFGRAVPLALALVMVMGAVAFATHSVAVTFDPASPVVEGTSVTATATASSAETAPKLQLHVCQAADSGVPIAGAYASYQTCIDATDGSAVWVLVKEQGPASAGAVSSISESFNTTGLGGQTAGFRGWREPGPNTSHPDAKGFANLVIEAQSTGGDGHPGCKGIENAYSKVSTNNGAGKGKGGEALERVADKLGCDLTE